MRISSSILREWRRRLPSRVPSELSSPCCLITTSLASRSLVATTAILRLNSDAQINTEKCQDADATTQSLKKLNIDPLTGKKRLGSNWNYSSELSALAHRIGVDSVHLPLLQVVLRDKSQSDSSPDSSVEEYPEERGHLSDLGRSVMLHYTHEYLYHSYPKLKTMMLQDVRDFLDSDSVVRDLAYHLGITQLIQTTKILSDPSNVRIIRNAFYAVIGLLYENQGGKAARSFVHNFIISQLANKDISELIKLQHPRFLLHGVLKSKGKPRPISRLIKESGRATHFPSFVVGVYSGVELLGEGCGTSLKRAEREAMLAALRTHFQRELANVVLPSDDQDAIPEDQLLRWTAMQRQQENLIDNYKPHDLKIEVKATV